MTRGYYYAVRNDGTPCGHRHYELSEALRRCWVQATPADIPGYPHLGGWKFGTGLVRYVNDRGEERPARTDEIAELETEQHGKSVHA